MAHLISVRDRYRVQCIGADGSTKWVEQFDNVIPMGGRKKILNSAFVTAGSTTFYVGLKSSGAPSTADTLDSHASWTEITGYSEGARVAWSVSTASSDTVSNTGSKAAFSISASTTVAGAFLANHTNSSGAADVLMGVGDFTAARAVVSGDTLNVSITATITSST